MKRTAVTIVNKQVSMKFRGKITDIGCIQHFSRKYDDIRSVLFSVRGGRKSKPSADGNLCAPRAIFRPWGTEK